ncbi:GPS domain-containing protein, partial [Caerostris extrusa]
CDQTPPANLSHGLLHGSSISGDTFHMFQRSALVLEVGQVQNEGQRVLSFPSRKATREVKEYSQPSWLTDSVELDFNTWIVENFQESKSTDLNCIFFLAKSIITHEHHETKFPKLRLGNSRR